MGAINAFNFQLITIYLLGQEAAYTFQGKKQRRSDCQGQVNFALTLKASENGSLVVQWAGAISVRSRVKDEQKKLVESLD